MAISLVGLDPDSKAFGRPRITGVPAGPLPGSRFGADLGRTELLPTSVAMPAVHAMPSFGVVPATAAMPALVGVPAALLPADVAAGPAPAERDATSVADARNDGRTDASAAWDLSASAAVPTAHAWAGERWRGGYPAGMPASLTREVRLSGIAAPVTQDSYAVRAATGHNDQLPTSARRHARSRGPSPTEQPV
jgi:hypothetical protein